MPLREPAARPVSPSGPFIKERTRLPDTLSGLLGRAIDDATSLSRNTYVPYSDHWHTARGDHVCEVCLAGCLIAGTLDNSPASSLWPSMFSANTRAKLETVNLMRLGKWHAAFWKHYLDSPYDMIDSKLHALHKPRDRNFCGWQEFLSHLNSLRVAVEPLRAIDTLARENDYVIRDHYC